MKCLSIQLHPRRDTRFSPDDLVLHLRTLGRYPEIDLDSDTSEYINLNLFTEDLNQLAKDINAHVLNDSTIGPWVKRVAIIACEGGQGWNDYLVLWHYDESEQTDDFPG